MHLFSTSALKANSALFDLSAAAKFAQLRSLRSCDIHLHGCNFATAADRQAAAKWIFCTTVGRQAAAKTCYSCVQHKLVS